MAFGAKSPGKMAAWLYRESGIASLYATGRDAGLVIVSRTCRMFAFGAVSLTIALFFSELGFSDFRIGLFMTLTLLGDVVLGLVVTLMADGLGRRRVMFAGGLLMAVSGLAFSVIENFWVLLFAAVVGVVSASGGDFGPFRAIEESMLSHITTPKTRADVLSWYVMCSSLGSAVGTELAGRYVEALKSRKGWTMLNAYHATFWIYIATGALNMLLALCMSDKCEVEKTPEETPDELAQGLLEDSDQEDDLDTTSSQQSSTESTSPKSKSRFSQISSGTRSVMYKLWFLLAVDSLADGMVSVTLTTYFLHRKFHLSKTRLGDIMSTAFILGTASTIFAVPLSRHLGLLNTMVFTHLPSSAAVLLFPAPSGLALTVVLLFVRMGLNPMDQAPRAAFIAAVVKPEERTAVMGITSTVRTLAMAVGPSLTGALAGSDKFWIAYVVGGVLRIMYDLGLWAMFVNMRLYAHETNDIDEAPRRESIDEEEVELQPPSRGQET
ncbi:major facilitator superfamily domain-containing protein [Dactylonectria macrodidyma]|uniref:Major facilitator superfamily domain-containing protein n=1 Tax=Dactylonectria macrodidyma TaxID=307937 RepID=A0A9P9IP69_9HYPO|nr:major facilitator superfamily domain-containing protein [Dactylonectria macrodidyma]